MEMKVLQEKDNQLLGRKEVRFEMRHTGGATPTKASVAKELASKYGVPEENIVIDYVLTKKGIAASEVKAKIYKEKPKIKAHAKSTKEKEAKTREKSGEAQAGPDK